MSKVRRWRDQARNLSWDKKALLLAGLAAVIPVFFHLGSSSYQAPLGQEDGADSGADTHIPRGFVLIPIEVANYEALDSVLGKFGVVDLFLSGSTAQRLVARNVRILRAPKNPSHFAVLVPEKQAPKILQFGGPFFVSVKGRHSPGTEFVESESRPHRKIIYEGG